MKGWFHHTIFLNINYSSYFKILFSATYLLNIKGLFTKQPIDCLTDNTVERLKVGLIGQSFDNRRYKINP